MKKLSLIVLFLCGCAVAPENRVNIKITNTTPIPMTLRAGSGIFATSVIIMPGQSWSGWIDRRFVGSSGWIQIDQFDPFKIQSQR